MKAIVKTVFVDKFDNLKQYNIGDVIEVADKSRLDDMIERGLVVAETADEKKTATTKKTKKGE